MWMTFRWMKQIPTPTTKMCSSPESKSSCRVSSCGAPLLDLDLTAPDTIPNICFVAKRVLSIPGLGSQGRSIEAGVDPVSRVSYRILRRFTRAGSSASSEQETLLTVAWNRSYAGDVINNQFIPGSETSLPRIFYQMGQRFLSRPMSSLHGRSRLGLWAGLYNVVRFPSCRLLDGRTYASP